MSSKFYPNIELIHIQSIVTAVKLSKSDSEWLPESSYGGQIVELIQELAGIVPEVQEEGEDGAADLDLVYETYKLYRDLNNTPKGTGKDAMAYYKTVSVVLGRLLDLTAKAEEISQYKKFKERVFMMFEHVMTPDQITDGVAYLKGDRTDLPEETK